VQLHQESNPLPAHQHGSGQFSRISFITQPTYLPWIGIFKAAQLVDTFILYDDVQFEKQSWQNRNRFLDSSRNLPVTLSVPVRKHNCETAIRDIEIAVPDFYEDHVRKLRAWYRRAPFLEPTLDVLLEVYTKRYARLAELTSALTMALARYLGIHSAFLFSHEFDIQGSKHTRPLAFARHLGNSMYLTQAGTRGYTDVEAFAAQGIKVIFLEFTHPVYQQMSAPFTPHLSIVDMLMNIGPQESSKVIENIQLNSAEA